PQRSTAAIAKWTRVRMGKVLQVVVRGDGVKGRIGARHIMHCDCISARASGGVHRYTSRSFATTRSSQ
ncbi:MAG TPA: hypothetical protein VIQ60_13485, partial [Gemmatimonadaceae bacterium]